MSLNPSLIAKGWSLSKCTDTCCSTLRVAKISPIQECKHTERFLKIAGICQLKHSSKMARPILMMLIKTGNGH
jgi:hypothetical protein